MLNGIDPIIIFQFQKILPSLFEKVSTTVEVPKIPVAADNQRKFPLPFIPIYLNERLTGIYIDSEDKNIDIETTQDTLTDGSTPVNNQRGLNSSVKISMLANRDSIGLTLLTALSDVVFPKVTSKEYSITYLHGAVTVFNGLLHSFAITQESNTDLYRITLELIRVGILPTTPITQLQKLPNAAVIK